MKTMTSWKLEDFCEAGEKDRNTFPQSIGVENEAVVSRLLFLSPAQEQAAWHHNEAMSPPHPPDFRSTIKPADVEQESDKQPVGASASERRPVLTLTLMLTLTLFMKPNQRASIQL